MTAAEREAFIRRYVGDRLKFCSFATVEARSKARRRFTTEAERWADEFADWDGETPPNVTAQDLER